MSEREREEVGILGVEYFSLHKFRNEPEYCSESSDVCKPISYQENVASTFVSITFFQSLFALLSYIKFTQPLQSVKRDFGWC